MKRIIMLPLLASLVACPKAEAPVSVAESHDQISTNNSGQDYIDECNEAGVPIPPPIFGSGWHNHGFIAAPFILDGLKAELWTWEAPIPNEDEEEGEEAPPNGLCMALPRFKGLGGDIEVLGLICMSRTTSKVCFFTNEADDRFRRTVPVELTELLGGADLDDNEEGICTDCHAGENPFIVHPQDSAFISALQTIEGGIMPMTWPTPIVPDSFPGNPTAIEHLGPTPDSACDSCHVQSVAGRLPLVSKTYAGFCKSVLRPAMGADNTNDAPPTMPPNGDIENYAGHRDWLLAACKVDDAQSHVGPFAPPLNEAFLPPMVVPPYACTRFVTVKAARLDALLTLYVDGVHVAQAIMDDPDGYLFELADPLEVGQLVEATQTIGFGTSLPGSAMVRDHQDDYPNGLPAPRIAPAPVYECARRVGVHHVAGATIVVSRMSSGGPSLRSKESGANLTPVRIDQTGPFEVGDLFSVFQRICDERSPNSTVVRAIDAPASLPKVEIGAVHVDQTHVELSSIVPGAAVELKRKDLGTTTTVINKTSYPFKRIKTADVEGPMTATAELVARQRLCGVPSKPSRQPDVDPCEPQMMAPEIVTPVGGDQTILIADAIPGATIRVFDHANAEIGNGTGAVIPLTVAVTGGEVIAVTQRLGPCQASVATYVVVQPAE